MTRMIPLKCVKAKDQRSIFQTNFIKLCIVLRKVNVNLRGVKNGNVGAKLEA